MTAKDAESDGPNPGADNADAQPTVPLGAEPSPVVPSENVLPPAVETSSSEHAPRRPFVQRTWVRIVGGILAGLILLGVGFGIGRASGHEGGDERGSHDSSDTDSRGDHGDRGPGGGHGFRGESGRGGGAPESDDDATTEPQTPTPAPDASVQPSPTATP